MEPQAHTKVLPSAHLTKTGCARGRAWAADGSENRASVLGSLGLRETGHRCLGGESGSGGLCSDPGLWALGILALPPRKLRACRSPARRRVVGDVCPSRSQSCCRELWASGEMLVCLTFYGFLSLSHTDVIQLPLCNFIVYFSHLGLESI